MELFSIEDMQRHVSSIEAAIQIENVPEFSPIFSHMQCANRGFCSRVDAYTTSDIAESYQ